MYHVQTANEIANTIRMMRTLYKGAIIIVEGKTDVLLFKKFFDNERCKLIPANNKTVAIEALKIIEESNLKGVLAIVDKDFWGLDGISASNKNIFTTDSHDVETMILSSEALDRFLDEFGDLSKLEKFNKSVRELLLDNALPIGFFRWISSPSKDDLYLKFKGLNFEEFTDVTSLTINVTKLIEAVKDNSEDPSVKTAEVKREISDLMCGEYDPWQVCSGHDLIEMLSIGLKHVFGNRRGKHLYPDQVVSTLRLAYELSFFSLTTLYNELQFWESINEPFKIFN